MSSSRQVFRTGAIAALTCVALATVAAADPLALEVASAKVIVDRSIGQPVIAVTLTPGARKAFTDFTAANLNRKVEFRVGGKVVMAPVIREPIRTGYFQVTASSANDADAAVRKLSAPGTKIEVEVVENR